MKTLEPKPGDRASQSLKDESSSGVPRATLLRSFYFAGQGIWYALRTQRNMQIHLGIGLVAVGLGVFFGIGGAEWAALLTVMALVYTLEMINTVVEAVVDMVTRQYHPLAKIAKDVAAGAVLLAAIFAVAVGCAIFLGRVWHLVLGWLGW